MCGAHRVRFCSTTPIEHTSLSPYTLIYRQGSSCGQPSRGALNFTLGQWTLSRIKRNAVLDCKGHAYRVSGRHRTVIYIKACYSDGCLTFLQLLKVFWNTCFSMKDIHCWQCQYVWSIYRNRNISIGHLTYCHKHCVVHWCPLLPTVTWYDAHCNLIRCAL